MALACNDISPSNAATVLKDKAVTIGAKLGNEKLALEIFDKIITKYKESCVPKIKLAVAKSYFNSGIIHQNIGDILHACISFYSANSHIDENNSIEFLDIKSSSMYEMIKILIRKRDEQSIKSANEFHQKILLNYNITKYKSIRETAARSLICMSELYTYQDKSIEYLNQAISILKSGTDENAFELLCQCYLLKSIQKKGPDYKINNTDELINMDSLTKEIGQEKAQRVYMYIDAYINISSLNNLMGRQA